MSTPTELLELERYIKGGCRKWSLLISDSHNDPMYSFDDLVQEAFAYMLGRLPHYNPNLSKLKTFVWNSLYNHFRYLKAKAQREQKTFVGLFNNSFDTLAPSESGSALLDDTQMQAIEEKDLHGMVREKLNAEEDFAFQCFMNPPSDIWDIVYAKRKKINKKRKCQTITIKPKFKDVCQYLVTVGGDAWCRKVIKSLRRKVQGALATS